MLITQRTMFIVAMGLAAVSASVFIFKNSGIELTENTLYIAVISAVGVVTALILYKARFFILFSRKKGKLISSSLDLAALLGLESITLHDKHITVKKGNRISLHAFFKVISVPYSIDDLNRERQIFVVGNFVRILSTLNFAFEIIPRILPVSPAVYLNQLHKEINDLRITLSAEGNVADARREARLKNLEKLAKRLQEGESVRDVSFLIHIMVEGDNEQILERELETNSKTLAAALESGLNVNAVRLERHEMLQSVREFFRLTMTISPRKSFRMLVWSLSFLIPLAKPKLPPISKLISGVYLGRTHSGAIVCIDQENYINPHIVVLGTTGGGKSTTVKSLVSRRQDIYQTPTIFLDYTGEYGPWIESRGGRVTDMAEKTINPFDLGSATLADRIRQVTEMFEKVCEFETINQRFAFVHYLNGAYAKKNFKINDPTTWKNEPPTLSDVIELIEADVPNLPLQKQATLVALLSRIKELASGPFGIFGKSDITIESLTQGFVCIDLSKISNNVLKDAISYTVLQFIDSKMRLDGMQKEIKLIVVLDEAWKIAKHPSSLPVVLIKEGRKYGFSIIISSQDATDDLAPQILSNAGTAIIHRITYPKYLKYVRDSYNLTELEIERIRDLPVGEAYVKIGNDPRGFFVKVEMEEVDVTQREEIQPVSIEKATNLNNSVKSENILPAIEQTENISPDQLSGKLSEKAKKLLEAVAEEPEHNTTGYYSKLKLTAYQGNKARIELEQYGLVEGVELPKITGKGRFGKVLRLTERGRKLVNQRQDSDRHGGLIHRHMVRRIANMLRAHKLDFEYPIGDGKAVDLVIDRKIAIEVEMRDLSESNITKNLSVGFEKVIVVCPTDIHVKKFREKLSETLASDSRIKIIDIASLLKTKNLRDITGARS